MPEVSPELYHGMSFFDRKYPFAIWKTTHEKERFTYDNTSRRDFWKIVYVIEGSGYKIINAKKYPLAPGNVYLVHPNDRTTFEIHSEHISIYNLVFMPSLFAGELKKLSSDFNFFSFFYWNFNESKLKSRQREQLYIVKTGQRVAQLFRQLLSEYETDDINAGNAIEYLLLLLLIELNREARNKLGSINSEKTVEYVEIYIHEHYSEEVTLANLAELVSMHPNYLCRLYRGKRGISIFDHLRKIRLDHAAVMLKQETANITSICFSCGFNNLSYFYRAFHKQYGMKPGDYRKKYCT